MDLNDIPIIKLDGTSFEKVLGTFLAVNNMREVKSGRKIELSIKEVNLEEISESPFDLIKKGPFANTKKVITESMFQGYIPRQEVYDTIEKYSSPENSSKIRQDINERFPEDKFEDSFPYCAAFNFLINDNRLKK